MYFPVLLAKKLVISAVEQSLGPANNGVGGKIRDKESIKLQ